MHLSRTLFARLAGDVCQAAAGSLPFPIGCACPFGARRSHITVDVAGKANLRSGLRVAAIATATLLILLSIIAVIVLRNHSRTATDSPIVNGTGPSDDSSRVANRAPIPPRRTTTPLVSSRMPTAHRGLWLIGPSRWRLYARRKSNWMIIPCCAGQMNRAARKLTLRSINEADSRINESPR